VIHLPRHIAIDGPAASGKSTLGAALAERLSYRFLDTGQMYRAVTRAAIERGIGVDDGPALAGVAESLTFSLTAEGLVIDGEPAGRELHTPQIDAYVSAVSSHAGVRAALVRTQRELADDRQIVMVGRDIGTTVLPNAPLKLWVTAPEAERTRRRSLEREQIDDERTSVVTTLGERDQRDSTRLHSPLQKASDAIVVDTGNRTPRQVLEYVLRLIHIEGASRDVESD
jgi:cytidylate kinase